MLIQPTKVKSPKSPPVGRGRGTGTGSKRGSGRGRGKKRVHHSEDNASEEEKVIPRSSKTSLKTGRDKKRVHHSEDNASEEEKVIPRSSKRRAAVAAASRMKQPSDYEDDDFDDVLPARPLPVAKPVPVSKPVTKTGRPRGRPPGSAGRGRKPAQISDDDDSDGGQNNVDDFSSSDGTPAKKKRASDKHKAKPTCQYGKECYRLVIIYHMHLH